METSNQDIGFLQTSQTDQFGKVIHGDCKVREDTVLIEACLSSLDMMLVGSVLSDIGKGD
jgi:hypothetical protein